MNTTPHAEPVYLVDGARTPFLKVTTGPGPFTPVDLAVAAGRPLLRRLALGGGDFDEVVLGCVNVHHDEVNPARVAALRLGCTEATPAWTVQRNCGSGMQSIDVGFRAIQSGRADLILAGGTEALSHTPLVMPAEFASWLGAWRTGTARDRTRLLAQLRPAHLVPIVSLIRGLTDPICGLNMGQTAEILAHRFDIDRAAADAFAVESHRRVTAAAEAGRLDEIEPICDLDGRLYELDTGVRSDSTVARLSQLKATFEPPYGKVTAGNSSQITDGASWVVLASERACAEHGMTPIARIVDCHWAALSPDIMGLGPVFASSPLLVRHGLALADVDLWEINEAFAAQVLACLSAWTDDDFCRSHLDPAGVYGTIDQARLNVDGGAIAVGHPVGASGNRIVLHLARALRSRGLGRGIATQCVGGGQGGAMLLEAMS